MIWLTVENSLLAAALLPLMGFLLLAFFGRRLGRDRAAAGVVSTILSVGSLALSLAALLLWVAPDSFNQPHKVLARTFHWITFSPKSALTGGILIDSLTIALFVMLTFMGVMAHLFALGSFPRLHRRPQLYACMQLLHFATLGLLLANSLPQLFVFWELVGVAAYFLVQACAGDDETGRLRGAGLRMYVMHGIGSAAFLLGIGVLVYHTGSLSRLGLLDENGASILVESVRQTLEVHPSEFLFYTGDGFMQMHWLTWAGICFLVAALARMGQFPLFHWVHAVAEAPAAVVGLLLGSTFLSAGVLLLARVFPIYTIDARLITAVVGCVSLTAGALIVLVQTDVRKVLAWSSVSQGGYVLLFLGAGGYTAGILQLFTHAFFKTALFLAAGAVVNGLGTADLRQMGGLWRRFPITAAASLVAMFALAGVPWLSGSYSTSLGLACVYDYALALGNGGSGRHEMLLFWIPAGVTFLTAWGIGRWWWLIFAGENRNPKLLEKSAESGFLTMPVILLAGFSAGGLFEFSGILRLISKSIVPVLRGAGVVIGEYPSYGYVLHITGWAFVGMALAALLSPADHRLAKACRRVPGVGLVAFWLRERMFFEELFEVVLLPGVLLVGRCVLLVERILEGVARLMGSVAGLPVRWFKGRAKPVVAEVPEESSTPSV